MARRLSREVKIGNVTIGGNNPIAIQSMCNTKTEDVTATVEQIKNLTAAGCEIIRVAVPTVKAANAIKEIKSKISIPLVADIHFDYKLAILAIENGADKIRINPGNIGDETKVKAVIDAAKSRNIPIRVGVNSGSLEKDLVKKYGDVPLILKAFDSTEDPDIKMARTPREEVVQQCYKDLRFAEEWLPEIDAVSSESDWGRVSKSAALLLSGLLVGIFATLFFVQIGRI